MAAPPARANFDPRCPRPPDGRRQHELVPELEELVGVDVELHVVLRSLPKNLLVHPSPVHPVVQVIENRSAAPANVKRKLNYARRLVAAVVAEVGDR